MPRIPITSPKGPDDCKEALGPAFSKFFEDLINTSIELDPKLSAVCVAILLLEREKGGLTQLSGVARARHFDRLIQVCVSARLITPSNYAECTWLFELVGKIMGLSTAKVEKTVNEELKRNRPVKSYSETDLVGLLRNQLPPIKAWNASPGEE